MTLEKHQTPSILAPAGNRSSFLAALAAGADAIYCGLKQFSAREAAKNFSIDELAQLTALAREKHTKVYVAVNSLLKPDDTDSATRLMVQLQEFAAPDGLIIQDLGLIQTIRKTHFSGEIHLSTLANISFPSALKLVRESLGVDRVVIPRELTIDEIKALASACPKGLGLEVFIHGALCYGISGRCYWSSILGGKSGLRGRCVQPCRRVYTHPPHQRGRFFSCKDLSLDVLVKVLMPIPQIRTWKIEGRKKGAHYVYYTVKAYRLLRDQGTDPQMRKTALGLLSYALGRNGTHYFFLPQRPQSPIGQAGHTGSGLFIGKVKGVSGKPYFITRESLFPGDFIRIGYEDQIGHGTFRISRAIPKRGRWYLNVNRCKRPNNDTSVFLTDRREKTLNDNLANLEKQLMKHQLIQLPPVNVNLRPPKKYILKATHQEMFVHRILTHTKKRQMTGVWFHKDNIRKIRKGHMNDCWIWLPPTVWPLGESEVKKKIQSALSLGCKNFVLNAPWQTSLFSSITKLNIWAGPMCNLANSQALHTIASMGYHGAIVSPELEARDYLQLPTISPLPLGIVVSGHWPHCISRVAPDNLAMDTPFTSPKGETAWVKKNGSDYWVYPNWIINIKSKMNILKGAGYHLFVHLHEPVPKQISLKERPGMWNWNLNLK